MKIHLVVTLAGAFALDDEGNIINTRPFKLIPKEVAKKINDIRQGILPKELDEIIKEHKQDEFVVQNANLGHILQGMGYQVNFEFQDQIIANFHKDIVNNLLNMGFIKKEEEYIKYLHTTTILITKEKVRQAADKRDRLIVHAIETIDDVDKTLNLFSNRLREFYGMHFPELVDAIENHYTFAKIVGVTGNKSNIDKKLLVEEINLPEDKAETILADRETTMGSNLLEQDIMIIQDQAKIVVDLYQRRQSLEKWMEEAMKTVAPNICGVINPLLGARLISLAGSLKDLALSPSSKIQVLGAEKALYRTIKTGAPPPKHGIIFQDPRLNQSKWWQRGKIARVLSGRISIASRMDYFEAEDRSVLFAKEITEKINDVLEKYPDPPKGQPKQYPKKPQMGPPNRRKAPPKRRN
ncbi:MAG TPA: hypothetical protein VMZ29_08295 [Candidatus Bathyarchaeia archaeon]|nr:hypothetical protein [Candidatus Bathyarchaeia archaeon]